VPVRKLRIVLAMALVLAPATGTAQNSRALKPTVAVMPVTFFSLVRSVDAASGRDAVTMMLNTEFGELSNLQIVERQRVDDLVVRELVRGSGRLTDQDAKRFGELLGAQYMVMSSMTIEPGTARFDIRLINVETGEPVKPALKKSGNPDRLSTLVESTVQEFMKGVALSATPNAVVVIPAAASLAYSRGLDYEKRGKKDQAAKMFQKALELFPEHPYAKEALDRVVK
jgi:TolB-like protein